MRLCRCVAPSRPTISLLALPVLKSLFGGSVLVFVLFSIFLRGLGPPLCRSTYEVEICLGSGLSISTIVLAELLHGAAKSARPEHNRREVERLASRLEVLAFDADTAGYAADIRAALERQGLVIGGYDLLIAGHARSRGLIIVTGNLGEFTRVEGLRSEDWSAD